MERGFGSCVPDVMGVTPRRDLIEIEIKRTMGDFRNNSKKFGMQRRKDWEGKAYWIPKYFYFLVETKMVDKVLSELPEDDLCVGVLSFPKEFEYATYYSNIPALVVRRKCQADRRAIKLPLKSVVLMAKHMAGTFSSLLCTLSNHIDRDLERRKAIST